MVEIDRSGGKSVIKIETECTEGDYVDHLRSLVSALQQIENRRERESIGDILKAFLPAEYQVKLTDE